MKSQTVHKVNTIHPLGNMNVCTKFHAASVAKMNDTLTDTVDLFSIIGVCEYVN